MNAEDAINEIFEGMTVSLSKDMKDVLFRAALAQTNSDLAAKLAIIMRLLTQELPFDEAMSAHLTAMQFAVVSVSTSLGKSFGSQPKRWSR